MEKSVFVPFVNAYSVRRLMFISDDGRKKKRKYLQSSEFDAIFNGALNILLR